jgi:hypothetical protein
VSTEALPELYAAALDFERQWWKYAGAKEAKIREQFDLTTVRFYQLLNAAIDHPAADAYDALLVKRLRRLRDARRSSRTATKRGVTL